MSPLPGSSEKTGKKFNTNCSVFGCFSKKQNNRSIHFHYIPKANSGVVKIRNDLGEEVVIDRRKAWERVLLLGKPITGHMRVCSKHFQASDYCSDVQLKQPKLKKTAIPSLNLPDRDKHVKSFFSNEGLKISQRIVDVIENRDHNFDGEDDITEHSFLYSSTNDTESELEGVYDELVNADLYELKQSSIDSLPLLNLPDVKQSKQLKRCLSKDTV